ncbi:hypothetical protein D1AOALGA4SA_5678 [Olavius algarvensis Delta 1 endosymbiont]|nr:hypothetical protein D1AOALGA4SA_5678 [Olavius algarvensis Delta 1 endosymbiont]
MSKGELRNQLNDECLMTNDELRISFQLKKTERSDIHKSSIFNLQPSIFNSGLSG